jgi:hypothetical protein
MLSPWWCCEMAVTTFFTLIQRRVVASIQEISSLEKLCWGDVRKHYISES